MDTNLHLEKLRRVCDCTIDDDRGFEGSYDGVPGWPLLPLLRRLVVGGEIPWYILVRAVLEACSITWRWV